MARRSSARLRARQQSMTPQPSKVLEAVVEHDELPNTPGAFPSSVSPEPDTITKLAEHIESVVSSPMKPATKEPQSTVSTPKPNRPSYPDLSNALTDTTMTTPPATPKVPQTCPPKASTRFEPPAIAVQTPGRLAASQQQHDYENPYQFTFRAQSLELSCEAKQMMAEKREEAARIKQQLNQEDVNQSGRAANSRKIAKGKPRVGRFSDVHMANFKKMDSIADHLTTTKPSAVKPPSTTLKSLKRTQSKADLGSTPTKSDLARQHVPGSAPPKYTRSAADNLGPMSPTKRVKRTAYDDTAISRSLTMHSPKSPSTPKRRPASTVATPNQNGKALHSQPSLHHKSSIKSLHASGIPTLAPSPSKSPAKTGYPDLAKASTSVLLQSPTRPPPSERKPASTPQGPSLAQSPVRPVHLRLYEDAKPDTDPRTPMLARSPVRMPMHQNEDNHGSPLVKTKTPMLHRSPVRPITSDAAGEGEESAATTGNVSRLTERFNKLRRSPVKSILRSPRRMPGKTMEMPHQSTPDRPTQHERLCPRTEPARKHVNFSASTKGEDGQSFKKSIMPFDIKSIAQNTFRYPKLPSIPDELSEDQTFSDPPVISKKFNRRKTLGADGLNDFTFRASREMQFPPTNEARFSELPTVLSEQSLTNGGKQSIRQVSTDSGSSEMVSNFENLSLPTKKRKYTEDQENLGQRDLDRAKNVASTTEDEELRPSKRSRPNATMTAPSVSRQSMSPVKRPSMAINKPSGSAMKHKPSTLTHARLAALAMPKRR